jgi:hypothetical protein
MRWLDAAFVKPEISKAASSRRTQERFAPSTKAVPGEIRNREPRSLEDL